MYYIIYIVYFIYYVTNVCCMYNIYMCCQCMYYVIYYELYAMWYIICIFDIHIILYVVYLFIMGCIISNRYPQIYVFQLLYLHVYHLCYSMLHDIMCYTTTISLMIQPLYKDPMMTSYTGSNGNNNNLRPQFTAAYSNGVLSSQTAAQQHTRLAQPQMTQAQQPQRVCVCGQNRMYMYVWYIQTHACCR